MFVRTCIKINEIMKMCTFQLNISFLRRNRFETSTDLQSVVMPGGQFSSRSGSGMLNKIIIFPFFYFVLT